MQKVIICESDLGYDVSYINIENYYIQCYEYSLHNFVIKYVYKIILC